jgi:hypothetical protein
MSVRRGVKASSFVYNANVNVSLYHSTEMIHVLVTNSFFSVFDVRGGPRINDFHFSFRLLINHHGVYGNFAFR